jgi:hypothetical protein
MTKQVFLALARRIGVAAGDAETARAIRDTVGEIIAERCAMLTRAPA